MEKLIFILVVTSLTALAQEKKITKDYRFLKKEFESRELVNLEIDSNELVYRIWIEPDLVIEVGQQVTITLYSKKYDRRKKGNVIINVKKIVPEINSQFLLSYFDSLNLSDWKDAEILEGFHARGVIHDGHRVLIEFSTKETYRSFSLYGPVTDQSERSKRTLNLINFLDEQLNPDQLRIDYYSKFASTDKDAKRLYKSIAEYKKDYRDQIDKKTFPKMWGYF